jgi:hypothetical protein
MSTNNLLKIAYPEDTTDPALQAIGITLPPVSNSKANSINAEPLKYDKPSVLRYIKDTVTRFTSWRAGGEGVGVGATAIQGTYITAAGIVAGVTAGGTTVAVAAVAFPATAGLAALAVIVGLILRQTALNEELRINLIMIKGEVERIYNIYTVIENIAIEKKLTINTFMVRKFTILLTNNILLVAGPDTFERIRTLSLGNGEGLFQQEKISEDLLTNTKAQINTKRKSYKSWWGNFFKRTIIPGEVLRTIVRDITILTVFFTILQSEFDLLSREKEEQDRTALFKAIGTDSGIKFQPNTVQAFENYYKSNNWINSDVFKRFKAQLPINNLNIAINDSIDGMKAHGIEPSPPPSNPASTPGTPKGGKRTMRRTHMKKRQSKQKTRSHK